MPGNTVRFDKSMSQGHDAAWEQDWKRAASFYREALEEFPGNPKALTSLGLALFELQDFPESLKNYQQAAVAAPDDVVAMERVGELLEILGKPDSAVEAFLRSAENAVKNRDVNKGIELWQRVLQLKPDHMMAHSRLALVYERLAKKPEAVMEYLILAGIFQHGGDVQKAMQAVAHAQQIAPGTPEPQQAMQMLKLGRLLPKPSAGRTTTGPRHTGPLIAPSTKPEEVEEPPIPDILSATRQKAMGELAELLFDQMEDSDDVTERRDMQSLITGGGTGNTQQADRTRIVLYLSTAIDLQTSQKDAQAIDELEKAIDSGLDHPAALFDLGYLYAQVNRFESAVRFLQKAVKYPDYSLGSHLLLGTIMMQLERKREAARELLWALKLADLQIVPPEQAEELGQMYDPLIEAQMQQPESEKPVQMCKNILDWLSRPNWRAQLKTLRGQMGSGGDGELTPLADMLTEASGTQVVEALAHIQRLSRMGKPRTAVEEAYFIMDTAPTYLPLHILVGDLLLQQGLYAEASEKFSVVARAYDIRGDINHSISLYRKIVDLSPMDMSLRNQLIDLLVGHGRLDDAVNEYMRLADIHYSLADLVNTRKSLDDAARLGQRSPNRSLRIKVLSRMADIDMQSLDWRQALRSYEQLRDIDPSDDQARKNLIELNFRLGQGQQALTEMNIYMNILIERQEYDTALQFMEGLLEAHPKQPAILRQAAEINRRAGNIEMAVAQLDRAGELFLEAGNKAAAADTILTILSLNPPNKTEYQALLAQLRG